MSRLDTLIKITAIGAFEGKSRVDVIGILSELGFQNRDIAMILATTPAYVAKVKYRSKKQLKKSSRKKPTQKKLNRNDE